MILSIIFNQGSCLDKPLSFLLRSRLIRPWTSLLKCVIPASIENLPVGIRSTLSRQSRQCFGLHPLKIDLAAPNTPENDPQVPDCHGAGTSEWNVLRPSDNIHLVLEDDLAMSAAALGVIP